MAAADVTTMPDEGRRRVAIDRVTPCLDGGRFPVKGILGDDVTVSADAFPDGHELIAVRLRHRPPGASVWQELAMSGPDNDRWTTPLPLTRLGRHEYTVVAWVDAFATWRHDLERRVEAQAVTRVDLAIGASLVRAGASRAERAVQVDSVPLGAGDAGGDAERMRALADALEGEPSAGRLAVALGAELGALMAGHPDRRFETSWEPILAVTVDPPRARFSAWYELFPRSASDEVGRHGTFRDVIARLPYVADLGFDVLYLPPIHPIGRTFRKGPNNALVAGPGDPGVPWAIGSAEGGHAAIHPELGSMEDFEALVAASRERDIELALDLAFQASADHPWLSEHREWFRERPDGTIQYAENPPKRYQDIYPFDFECADWRGLWEALLDVVRTWMARGVRIFRVDNPHTKPFDFWEWLIASVKERDPDVLFLAEAFTRPKVMYRLAKLGFSQSYTYFTWRNTRAELTSYLEEITRPPVAEFFRPNLFANTPDILHAYLQERGRPAFAARLVLAATLGASYGIYGPPFELAEATAREPGSEEYLDSEKYEQRHWDLDRPDSLAPLIRRVNAIRRAHPALHSDERLRFVPTDHDQVVAYSKHTPDGSDIILAVVDLEPSLRRAVRVTLPLTDYGLDAGGLLARDLLAGPEDAGPAERRAVSGAVLEVELRGPDQAAGIYQLVPA